MTRLIDADALIHKLKTAIELGQKVDESVSELEAVLDDVESMPTIEIEPQWIPCSDAEPVRHGKWIFNPSDAFEAMFAKPKCSECGFESADGGNYCPNCGARMDKE